MRDAPACCGGSRPGCFCAGETVRAGLALASTDFVFDFAAPRTSVSVTRPSGPVPLTLARSTPNSAATRRATGDAFTRASPPLSIFAAGFCASGFFSAFFSSLFSEGFSSFFSVGFGSAFFSSFSSALASAVFSFGLSSFSGASSFLGASSPSPPMNAILSPTFTFPPSST